MDDSDHLPVIVVGASQAGLFAAELLAQRGVPVEVYERNETFKPKSRTLIVTPELERVLGFSAGSAVVNRVHTLELCTAQRVVPIRLAEPDLIVERAELLRILAARAVAAGVCIHWGQSFQALETDGRQTTAHFATRGTDQAAHAAARTVIAADGARSQVARCLGYEPQPTVTVIQARVALRTRIDPGVGKVWFRPSETPFFYWFCPESPHAAAVGLVDVEQRRARPKLDRFLSEHRMQPLEYQAALIPLYQPRSPVRRLGRTDIMMIGDAAGQVKVTTVGGTVSGLLGAHAASRAVLRGSKYTRELGGLDRELRLHWLIRKLMSRLHEHEYDALLHMLSGKVATLLQIHNRDRLVPGMWPIMAAQPRLSLLAVQMFWRGLAGT